MDDLGNLLGRIRNSLDKDIEIREAAAGCIKEKLGFDVRLEDISLKGHTLRIKTSPAKKNEIRLHEEVVLGAIRARTKLDIKAISY